ncbi:MAG TPA: 4Fe-4S binding protein [Candidatus Methanoperedenaceae archaeon]|nr:4Fe-4S binding protein [Candidatus Methanoperedenaceae archaeon]
MLVFWIIAVLMWQSTGVIFYLFNFMYIGTSIGLGSMVYTILPKKKKPAGRRLTLFLVGGYMLLFLGFFAHENMQIEGFFFYLLAGFFAGSVLHYTIAKIFGPFLFGRAWCGWACWTAMFLELLPYKKSQGRMPGTWGHLRYVHFSISLSIVLFLVLWSGYRVQVGGITELYWLLAGNAIYYSTAIPLAFVVKDNRAFCKYLCPITVFLKGSSRFSLMKVRGDSDKCTECGACARNCPMDIRIPDYIKNDARVLSTECILCQTCINTCPEAALGLSFGFDIGGRGLLHEKKM